MKVLMVCMGNICRSPLAQGILEYKIKMAGLDWQVDSAGTGGWHAGQQPDERSIAVARKHGIHISDQAARKLRPADMDTFDLIYCMDSTNYKEVTEMCHNEEEEAKVMMIMNEADPGRNINVPDPYYGGADGFELVYQMLDKACEAIVKNRQ